MRAMILMVLTAISAGAADREFNEIVQAISDRYHTRPTNIPFMGLVNAFAFVARPAGTHHLDLAVFERLDGPMEAGEIRRIVGHSWAPFVQVTSRKNAETTLIYVRPGGRDTRLLITTMQRREATVVELKVDVNALRKWIDDPAMSAKKHHGDIGQGEFEP